MSRARVKYRSIRFVVGMQWLCLLCLAVLGWFLWPAPVATPAPMTAERKNWDGFLAIAYGRIAHEASDSAMSADQFREHMESLAAAGYRPVTLDEVHDFLFEARPLPQKAVLISLEDGWKESAEFAEKVLEELRFPATFILRLEPIESSHRLFVTWHALRCLKATGRWSFGTRGCQALRLVPTDSGGTQGPFLTSYAYLPELGRVEGSAEWKQRAEAEIGEASRILNKRIPGCGTLLFSFPWGDDGKAMPDRGEALSEIVGQKFPLAFARTGYAFNHRASDPTELSRLVVSPEWTGAELVHRLAAQDARRTGFFEGTDRDWVFVHGRLQKESSRTLLEPSSGRGAEAWLGGSEEWRSLQASVTVETRPDVQSWLYLRAVPGRRFLRIGWNGTAIELQSRVEGGSVKSMTKGRAPDEAEFATITVELLERRVRFAVEDGYAPERSFPLPEELDRGMSGIGTWHLGEDLDPVSFQDLWLEPRLSTGFLVRDIQEARSGLPAVVDVIAPQWYQLLPSGYGFTLKGTSDSALSLFAAYRGASVWPVVSLTAVPSADSVASLAEEIQKAGQDPGTQGVILDLRSTRATGKTMEFEVLKALAEKVSAPLGIIPDRDVEEVLAAFPSEKLAKIVLSDVEGSSCKVPPEKLLLIKETSR